MRNDIPETVAGCIETISRLIQADIADAAGKGIKHGVVYNSVQHLTFPVYEDSDTHVTLTINVRAGHDGKVEP